MNSLLDAHTHSVFSDGELAVGEIATLAREKGLQVGISDHVGSTYPLNSAESVGRYLSALHSHAVLKAVELNINEVFVLSESVLEKLDYVIGGVHFEGEHMVGVPGISAAEPDRFVEIVVDIILRACRERRMDILSHPTCLPRSLEDGAEHLFNEDRANRIIGACLDNDIALEINNHFGVPHKSFLKTALEMGASFSFGSDAHGRGEMCNLTYCLKMARALRIPERQLFTDMSSQVGTRG